MLVNEESFRAEMKKLKDKWEKKNSSANISSHSLFEWFKNYKTDIMISYMIEAVRKENGLCLKWGMVTSTLHSLPIMA